MSVQAPTVVGHAESVAKGTVDAVTPGMTQQTLDVVTKYQLTDAELAAIKIYTVDDYKYINPAMAEIPAWMKAQIPEIAGAKSKDISDQGIQSATAEGQLHGKMAKKGLKRLPDVVGTVYRGEVHQPDKCLAKAQKGGELRYDAFMSTSINPRTANDFVAQQQQKDPTLKGLILTLEVVEKGKDIAALSYYQKESEVLFLPGQRFKILSVVDWGTYFAIRAEQIPQPAKVKF
jgi:hypothetical protein